jgi:hypothetical protein
MSNFLHWVQIDASAAAKAEQALDEGIGEVRDEIGFMAIHHAFANRFFPGTSVLHTRLRYIFFAPWLMNQVAAQREDLPLLEHLKRAEARVKDQLKAAGAGPGIIGIRAPRHRMFSQFPSAIYWNALRNWGFLRAREDDSYPGRLEALNSLATLSDPVKRTAHDDDGAILDDMVSPFIDSLPTVCPQIRTGKGKLTFKLDRDEKRSLKEIISSANSLARDSILTRLMKSDTPLPTPKRQEFNVVSGWPDWINELCNDKERKDLKVASYAAALSCIGRGVYAALVQMLRKRDGKASGKTDHQALLREAVQKYGSKASQLDIKNLEQLFSDDPLPSSIVNVLKETKAWLKIGSRHDPEDLLDCYLQAEKPRKENQSRLPPDARECRSEWNPDKVSPATPLHYRLRIVHRLVWDIQN